MDPREPSTSLEASRPTIVLISESGARWTADRELIFAQCRCFRTVHELYGATEIPVDASDAVLRKFIEWCAFRSETDGIEDELQAKHHPHLELHEKWLCERSHVPLLLELLQFAEKLECDALFASIATFINDKLSKLDHDDVKKFLEGSKRRKNSSGER